MYYVYMAENDKEELYIGITKDPQKRLYYHNTNQGASFTKNRNNFRVVFIEKYNALKDARQREMQIKKWRREKKNLLIKRYFLGLPTKYKKTKTATDSNRVEQ